MKKIYNKLVRDKIPEIIERDGKKCVTEVLSREQYIAALDRKLDEELAEYHSQPCAEELADLLEVVYAVTTARGYGVEKLEQVRAEKAGRRGGFEKRLLLKEVIEE